MRDWLEGLISSCDAFPKVDVSYLNPTTSGGITSIAAYGLIGLLSLGEIWRYFMVPLVNYSLQVDTEMQSEIRLSFDISIATPCDQLVVAVVDAGGQKEILNQLVSPEPIVWRRPNVEGCRIRANIPLNKVAGELLILPQAGVLPGPFGHLLLFIDHRVNFSHRIHRFSFGPSGDALLGRDFREKHFRNPLEGALQDNLDRNQRFTYSLSVVPTKFITPDGRVKLSTNQYSVVGSKSRKDDPSVILPGLYFSYDLGALSVTIKREYKPLLWFLVNVLGIIGGIYTCSGLLHHCMHHLYLYYIAGRNAFKGHYLGALDGYLPTGLSSATKSSCCYSPIPLASNENVVKKG